MIQATSAEKYEAEKLLYRLRAYPPSGTLSAPVQSEDVKILAEALHDAKVKGLPASVYPSISDLSGKLEKMSAVQGDVFAAIIGERQFQDQKWGVMPHEVPTWIGYMQHYLHHAMAAATRGEHYEAQHQMRKAVALGVACFEEHGCPPRN